jgi:hypothetical protein
MSEFRLLLDESVPKALGFKLEPYFVRTAQTAGFAGLLNGELLAAMKTAKFNVLITFDQNLPYQQNVNLPVAVVVLVSKNNRIETALRFAEPLLECLQSLKAEQLVRLQLKD